MDEPLSLSPTFHAQTLNNMTLYIKLTIQGAKAFHDFHLSLSLSLTLASSLSFTHTETYINGWEMDGTFLHNTL